MLHTLVYRGDCMPQPQTPYTETFGPSEAHLEAEAEMYALMIYHEGRKDDTLNICIG